MQIRNLTVFEDVLRFNKGKEMVLIQTYAPSSKQVTFICLNKDQLPEDYQRVTAVFYLKKLSKR